MYASFQQPQKINIDPGSYLDLFYRYKMPQVHVLHQKNRTILTNLDAVAKALHVPSLSLLKYIGSSIGTATIAKTSSLNGLHDPSTISAIMIKFIEEEVLCRVCGLPEKNTVNNGTVCNSCGDRVKK